LATASVSAVVPVYQGADTLDRCLASLRAQGPLLHEIVLVDDGSTDGSREILRRYAATDPRFRVIEHAENRGIARTLNEGIAQASGDAVLLIHQDCELQGADWVARAAAFLDGHPKTVASGSPVYPLKEMNRTEVAFGLLRDTFFVAPEPAEDLAFSEFKCDLLLRDAFRGGAFDERFRASGEDQVFSMQLAAAGYRIVRVRDLGYAQRFGKARTVGAQLRKEVAYGTTEGGILLRTSFRVARESSGSRTSGRRLANRAAALLAALALLAFLVLLLVGPSPWLALLPLLLLVPRIAMLVSRALRLHPPDGGPRGALPFALTLFLVNDPLYALAVLRGVIVYAARRRV
jgi:hypothetical protein